MTVKPFAAAPPSAGRRRVLRSLAVIGAGGAGMLLLRRQIVGASPAVQAEGGAQASGWLPLRAPRGQWILSVPMTLAGRTVTGLIDTGAQLSAVDRALAEALALSSAPVPMIVFGLGGGPMLGPTARFDLGIGALAVSGLRAARLDLRGLGLPPEAAFSVILGQNALRALVVDMDLPRRRVQLHPAAAYAPPGGAVAVQARLERGRLVAPVRVGGTEIEAVVDTGASGVLTLAADVAERAGLLQDAVARRRSSITLGGLQSGWEVVLPDLEFAGLRLGSVPVQIYDRGAAGPLASRMLPDGLLGLGALRQVRSAVALGEGRLYVLPA